MKVKGTGLIARKQMLSREIGEENWDRFYEEFAQGEPFFRQPIIATTLIPVELYVKFNEELIKRFFGADPKAHWLFGEKSAEWAFTQGPYKSIFFTGDFKKFLADVPFIWRTYYTEGVAVTGQDGNVFDVRITDVPFPHVYFEYTVLGYIKKGLELTGAKNLETRKLRGFSLGDGDIHYQFVMTP